MKTYAMECFLKVNRLVLFPDGSTAWITAFTNEDIASNRCVFLFLFWQKAHLEHIGQIGAEPPNVEIPKIRLWLTSILGFVEHLTKRVLCDLPDFLARPPILHT